MHRTIRSPLTALGLVVVTVGSLTAQSLQTLFPRDEAGSLATLLTGDQLLSDGAREAMSPSSLSAMDRVGQAALYTAGFALVGGGMGYFASQVAYSDWDKETDAAFAPRRRAFSISGAAIGGAVGLVLGMRARPGPTQSNVPIHQELAGGDVIVVQELTQGGYTTAYDAIRALRPNWLLVRGVRPGTSAIPIVDGDRITGIIEAIPTIKVYRDNAQLGGIDTLRDISIASIVRIQRLSAAEATNRWGAGHMEGAILVESRLD